MEENNQEQNQEQINVAQNLNEETKFTPLGQINETVPKKKKSKVGVVVFILILLAAIIGGLAYYYFQIYTNPKVVYGQILKTGINKLTATSDEEITTLKGKVKLDVDVNLDESYIQAGEKELIDLINNIEATAEMQMDINEEKLLLKLDSNYENEELLNFDMQLDVKDEKGYIKAEQFFEDVLVTEDVDFDDLKQAFEELKKALENEDSTFGDKITREKAFGILGEEFATIIKDEYCSKEKEKITVNGKEINADKYVLKMTYTQMKDELKTVCENLKNNEEFLNCFEDKEELEETLKNAIEEIEKSNDEDATLYIKLYKTGLKQEFVRIDCELEINEEKVVVKVEKLDDAYGFDVNTTEEKICSGTVKTEKIDENTTRLDLTFKVEDAIDLAINMEYGYAINEAIDTIDTENAVTTDELTEADMLRAYANLEESKLYELIEEFSSLSNDMGGDTNIELPNDDENAEVQIPNDDTTMNNLEKNITSNGKTTKAGKLVVFAKNNNDVAVDMDIEVEFYDENGIFVGSAQDYLNAVGAGNEIAMEMISTPSNYSTYKIYIEAEETQETEYFDQIEMTHNNNGENIAVQVKNNSESKIEYITVTVVYYSNGEVVGIEDGIVSDVNPGRSGNFNIYFPYDSEYNDVAFDDYKVYVTEAYSYNG